MNIFVWYAVSAEARGDVLTVAFLDVGQGDAIFIETPSGNQVLIDGGANAKVLEELGTVMPFYDRSLDLVIATHPDKDHIGGLPDVFAAYEVSSIIDPGIPSDTGTYGEYVRHIQDEGGVYIQARRGQVIDLGDGVYIRILFPDRDVSGVEANDGSVILQLVYGETEFLLTGDASKAIELYLLTLDGTTLESDVLKAGHHGSDTSSAGVFVRTVDPEYAVISAGKDNRFGHPHQEVLDTLHEAETQIFRTYEKGTVVFESNGKSVLPKE